MEYALVKNNNVIKTVKIDKSDKIKIKKLEDSSSYYPIEYQPVEYDKNTQMLDTKWIIERYKVIKTYNVINISEKEEKVIKEQRKNDIRIEKIEKRIREIEEKRKKELFEEVVKQLIDEGEIDE